MVSIKDIADVIKMLGDVVESTRKIVEAVNDGKKFLALNYPNAQQDFGNLIGQMQKAIEGLAKVTSVMSNFRFVTSREITDFATANSELTRFNDYIIKQSTDIDALRNEIRSLKANCEKVRELRDQLDAFSQERSWGSLFGLLGDKARQRSIELHQPISNFYADDQRMIELLTQTLDLAVSAIGDIGDVIGPPGMANPYNVPNAAALLGTFSTLFSEPNKALHKLADVMSATQSALITGSGK
jgi:hypothetical protein